METLITLLVEFMSKVLGAAQQRKSQNKQTEEERFGLYSFVDLKRWINENTETVKAAIANDTWMFNLIMKKAHKTLNSYIKTGVWNKLYWVYSSETSRIYFVWTPENGKTFSSQEENRFKSEIRKAELMLHNKGYSVCGTQLDFLKEGETDFGQNAIGRSNSKYHLDRWGYYTRGKRKVAEEGKSASVDWASGNVFELLQSFLEL